MTTFNPEWEYYQADPEIDEIVHGIRTRSVLRVYDSRVTGGFSQVKTPDGYRSRLGPERMTRQPGPRPTRQVKRCAKCNKLFLPDRPEQTYCSVKCRGRLGGTVARVLATKRCAWCPNTFVPRRPCEADRRECCSHSCKNRLWHHRRNQVRPQSGE